MKNEIKHYISSGESKDTRLDKEDSIPDDEEDEFGDFETTGSEHEKKSLDSKEESLATLVQEELPSLSKHWLAALKDHALLSLPIDFKSQLPYDGGAFYTNDTIESARPHYRYEKNISSKY